MRLTRTSLCGILLERGEEDLAVLIARADLPEVLDSGRDAPALAALGLGEDELRGLLPAVSRDTLDTADPEEREERELKEREQEKQMSLLRQTISDRWAHLVTVWTAAAAR